MSESSEDKYALYHFLARAGSKGGKISSKKRVAAMTPEKRKEWGQNTANARYGNRKSKREDSGDAHK